MVRRAQVHNVVVARQQPAANEFPDLQFGIPLQRLGDFLGHDLPAENAREAIADDAFESALKALHEAHGTFLPRVRLLVPSYLGQRAATPPSSQQVLPPAEGARPAVLICFRQQGRGKRKRPGANGRKRAV
ncbi:hypothetical protein GCM10023108_02910 [Saccharopolyspora hordei]